MKKLLSLLLALVMMLGVAFTLASCGEDPPPEVPDTPDVPDPPVDPNKPVEPVEVPKDYAWTKADNKKINIKLNLDSSGWGNLALRYIAGADENATAVVDDLIAIRNENAQDITMVTPNYSYWEDGIKEGQWGKTQTQIINDKNSFDAATTPDIYITSLYDSLLATFENALANVAGTKRDNGKNYFTFIEEGYYDDGKDLGYNYELMRSFSPIPDDVMFIVTSDYTIDTFRALHAMPVSITMMEGFNANLLISEKNVPDFDYDDNGTFEMSELLEFVWNGKWTWDVMATLCAASYVASGVVTEESFGDTQFGFYMNTDDGAPGRALSFSTKFAHLDKTVDANGVPTYTQRDKTDFEALAAALERLFDVKGAMKVSEKDVKNYTSLTQVGSYAVTGGAIMEKFGRNEILFAGLGQIGQIEQTYFQEMTGLFGIVPIPLIEEGDENTDYTTALGNAARVATIGVNTDDFMEATAYLDYQSTHSSEILGRYFRSQQYDYTNGEDYNIRMLEYLRTILVDQEAHVLEIQATVYKYSEEEKAKYFTLEASLYQEPYTEGGYRNYKSVTYMWRSDTKATVALDELYTEQLKNTANALYKLTVDRYLAAKGVL